MSRVGIVRNKLYFCAFYQCINVGESLTIRIKTKELYVKFVTVHWHLHIDIIHKNYKNEIHFYNQSFILQIEYKELVHFIERTGVSLQTRFLGYKRQEINGLFSFLNTLQSSMLTNLKRIFVEVRNSSIKHYNFQGNLSYLCRR